MSSPITGIPTTRLSNQYMQQRLLSQLNFDQTDLFRIQTQVSSGRRLLAPSDDPTSAVRSQALQSLLERKTQVKTNLETTQSYLAASDSALSSVSGLLASAHGSALGVVDTISSDEQRNAVKVEIDQTVQQLLSASTQQFRERHLFSGSKTTEAAFEFHDGFVRYNGNEQRLYSYSDIDALFETNMDGHEVFGALSEPVRGSVDLNPELSADTRLADLRGGRGIELGSIVVSDASNTTTVDLSGAETIGDVAALLEANPPSGRTLTATITTSGLTISLDGGGGGNLTINDTAEGRTADQLGIRSTSGIGTGPLVGADLDPQLRKTTALASIAGGTLDLASGLLITNGNTTYSIDLSAAETVEDVLNTLNSSEASVLATINKEGTGIDVRSRLSGADFSIGENGGSTATDLGLRSFVGETDLPDLNRGLGVHTGSGTDFEILRRDGTRLEFDASNWATVQDALDAINNHVDNQNPATRVTAQLAETGNGIELITNDTSITATLTVQAKNGSQAAVDLGLIPVGATQSDPPTNSGSRLTGRDVNLLEVTGAFNSLLRLSQALSANDLREMSRSVTQLDESALGVNFARAELGARQQSIDTLQLRLEDEEVELQLALSGELDVDMAEAITNFTNRQAALQASLQTSAAISRLTLLDFL